ncbi:MAG: hypothetical protein AB7W28_02080 [Armatimonadota bacterium]
MADFDKDDDVLDVEIEGPRATTPPPGQQQSISPHVGGISWRWPLLAVGLLLLVILPFLYMTFGSAQARARRHFLSGIALQTASRYEEAIAEFEKAIELDDRLAAAAVRLGLAQLHLGSPAPDARYIRELLQRAMHGDTGALDAADKAFQKALEMVQRVKPTGRFPDAAQPGANQVRANAHSGLGLTRVLRASAALGAGQVPQAKAWAEDAINHARLARSADPGNVLASIIDSLAELLLGYANLGELEIF